MKFYALENAELYPMDLTAEYSAARSIGSISIGESHLFYKKFRKVYCVAYSEIRRCFRRVVLVPMKLCCGGGDMHMENLVVETEAGEIAQLPLPGERAARTAIDELKKKMPHAEFQAPKTETE
ncbi:MAG: hypothetical protein Q4B01_01580 [Eubacteriales bacterium]|nr:hypothetical protein [Eubacteriales bacterium]